MDGLLNILIVFICGVLISAVLGYVFGAGLSNNKVFKQFKLTNNIIGIIIFGIVSIMGTTLGAVTQTAITNFRDLGPIAGGLWFGPIVGIGAAIIGAVYRWGVTAYLGYGAISMLPCVLGTLAAGALGGVLWYFCRSKINFITATIAAFFIECVHLIFVVILVPDGISIALGEAGIGTLLNTTFGVLAFSLVYQKTKNNEEKA